MADSRLIGKRLTHQSIQQRRKLQLPNSVKINHSDFVIDNNGSIEFLKLQINRLYHTLESLKAS
jgi:dephospho-CoA kinase